MTNEQAKTIKPGSVIVYDDGREGHRGVKAEVLEVSAVGMVVQFTDHADTSTIMFHDKGWMDYIRLDDVEAD